MNPSIDDSNIFCLQKGLIFMFGLGTEPVLPEVLLPESKQRPQLLLCVRSLCFKIIPCYVVFLNCFVGRGFITLFSYFHAFYSINTSTMIHPSFSANATHCIVKINRVRIRLNMAYSQPHPMQKLNSKTLCLHHLDKIIQTINVSFSCAFYMNYTEMIWQ